MTVHVRLAALLALWAPLPALAVGTPYATSFVSYAPGLVPDALYTNPLTATGSPERITGEFVGWPGAVTPFNPAFGPDEVVSVGGGGHLTIAFEHDVLDDPANPFGMDFLVFGNAGFIDANWPSGTTTSSGAMFGVGAPAIVHVSADGTDWRLVSGLVDAAFPTLGYTDLADPYAAGPGSVFADFTRPVDPGLSFANSTFGAIVAGYAGSGGGAGFDITPTGLPFIRFVRFTNPSADAVAFEIDAISDVAVPSPMVSFPLALFLTAWPRRRAT